MRKLCFSWGNLVTNLFIDRVQNTGLYTNYFSTPSFTKLFLIFYQPLSSAISCISPQLKTIFYPFSTPSNNNKNLINLYIY